MLGFVNPPALKEDPNAEIARPIRFVPTNYAEDFAMIRTIDDAFESRLQETPEIATTQAAPGN